ncbi:glycoside hydrolase family 73 protein [Lacticaseibacillus thailandensis]|uniref:glycoside hydrolase family 73 protein n=1 Tax=Lacticaseibacillus thailandensis TaxID=381741 RepID=UPI0006D181A8|nr:glycoside hydrolase family 73 protein [Lacticaseibacillus thailandensis]
MARKRKSKLRRRWSRWWRRHPLPTGLISTLAIIVVGVTVIGVRAFQQAGNNAARVATTNRQHQQFINHLAGYAQTLQINYGVRASITLGQAVLESDWGTSKLASQYHNLFGVKADAQQVGKELSTQEYRHGQWVTVTAKFRTYSSDYASMREHAELLQNGTSWNAQQYQGVIHAATYQDAARALQSSGYVTDPTYARKLIKIIQQYRLYRYDQQNTSSSSR